MMGAALGGGASLFWLYNDVQKVSAALTRKIDSVRLEVCESLIPNGSGICLWKWVSDNS